MKVEPHISYASTNMRWLSHRVASYPTAIFTDKNEVNSLASRGFYYDDETRSLICYECEGVDEIHETGCFITHLNRLINDLSSSKQQLLQDSRENNSEKKDDLQHLSLYERILSFQDGWKSSFEEDANLISYPDQIALAGFYFIGSLNALRCPYCFIEVRTHKNVSLTDHRRINPSCRFLNELKNEDNILCK